MTRAKELKGQKSQLARMLKASLPNEWSYELAEEVVRDYVQRNFVDKGMCADWAIHDSENDKGQRNLHIHVLLTIRPITENGEAEIQSLQSEYDSIGKAQTKTAKELAYAEIISYNKKNLERELQNESRQHNRQQSRTKRREEEI